VVQRALPALRYGRGTRAFGTRRVPQRARLPEGLTARAAARGHRAGRDASPVRSSAERAAPGRPSRARSLEWRTEMTTCPLRRLPASRLAWRRSLTSCQNESNGNGADMTNDDPPGAASLAVGAGDHTGPTWPHHARNVDPCTGLRNCNSRNLKRGAQIELRSPAAILAPLAEKPVGLRRPDVAARIRNGAEAPPPPAGPKPKAPR
jgi:hypothetical protein